MKIKYKKCMASETMWTDHNFNIHPALTHGPPYNTLTWTLECGQCVLGKCNQTES